MGRDRLQTVVLPSLIWTNGGGADGDAGGCYSIDTRRVSRGILLGVD